MDTTTDKFKKMQDLINIFELPEEDIENEENVYVQLNENEINDLLETAGILICDTIYNDPMVYIQPSFHSDIVNQVSELLLEQLKPICECTCSSNNSSTCIKEYAHRICNESICNESICICNESICNESICICNESICNESILKDIKDPSSLIEAIVEEAMSIFYTHISPKRSYLTTLTYSNNLIDKERISNKIYYLQNVPQPEQRTNEWYLFRQKFLTASSIWKAFISNSTKNQLIYDKCQPVNIEKYKHFSTDSPMHWGQRYEPVSIMYYEKKYQTIISDFGCISHRTLSFLAASPDGINTLDSSLRYGRMLEIKNIVNRVIDGNPKMEYWIQMQLQMEVCMLNECDFLETRFLEYESKEAFLEDNYHDDIVSYSMCKSGFPKGIILYFIKNGQPFYIYAQLGMNNSETLLWEEEQMNKYNELTWIKTIYWKLEEVSCVLVLRNKLWFKTAIPILQDIWNTIEYEKVNGYSHRAPKSNVNKKLRLNKNNESDSSDFVLNKTCQISISMT
jgi:putative phage-type endonuclease